MQSLYPAAMPANHHTTRKTLATSIAKPAPLRIVLLSIPLWAVSMILIFFMPFTAIISFIIIAICLLWFPFTAKRGACPQCGLLKTIPFSGFGSTCRKCGADLVLRGSQIHYIESKTVRYGSGRST